MSEVKVSKGQSMGRNDPSEIGRSYEPPLFPYSRFFGMNPFAVMRELTNEMDRAFRGWGNGRELDAWMPAVDVQQCGGNLMISAELPGLKKEDVKVELTDDSLIIEGERKREHREDHEGLHRWERSYGRFFRTVPLPEGARADQAKAELKDGILRISMPAPESKKKMRQLPVEEGAKAATSTV